MKIREIRELPRYLRRRARMPIARFELISSREPELVSVALNDVVLLDPEDTMAEVKERAAQIARFRDKGLLTTRYDIRFADGDLEALYEDSALFGELWVLSQQGRGKEGYLDHPDSQGPGPLRRPGARGHPLLRQDTEENIRLLALEVSDIWLT